jgi:hypothetical protein
MGVAAYATPWKIRTEARIVKAMTIADHTAKLHSRAQAGQDRRRRAAGLVAACDVLDRRA